MFNRRQFIKYSAALGAGLLLASRQDIGTALAARNARSSRAIGARARVDRDRHRPGHGHGPGPGMALPAGTLDPASITKYVTPLLIPPVMPRNTLSGQQAGAGHRLL